MDRLDHEGQGAQVHVEHGIPLRNLEFVQRDGHRYTRGVNQAADRRQRGACRANRGIDRIGSAQIDPDACRRDVEALPDIPRHALRRFFVQIPDRDGAPGGSQRLGAGHPDAGRASRDDYAALRGRGMVHIVCS